MTKITLKDNTELYSIAVHSDKKYFGDKSREVLTFLFPENISTNQLIGLFTEENCSEIILGEDEYDQEGNKINEPYLWENYVNFLSAGTGIIADVIIGSADMTPCTWIRMAQLTPEELRIKELEAMLANLNK